MHSQVVAVKLCSAADIQMIWNNAEKEFFTCKHNSNKLGKVTSVSQSRVSQFFLIV